VQEAASVERVEKALANLKKPLSFWADVDERCLKKFLAIHFYHKSKKHYKLPFPPNSTRSL